MVESTALITRANSPKSINFPANLVPKRSGFPISSGLKRQLSGNIFGANRLQSFYDQRQIGGVQLAWIAIGKPNGRQYDLSSGACATGRARRK
jgi:hypothetical protein